MRVLVTGGSGFIGRHVVRTLTEHGHEAVVADLVRFPSPGVACVEGDLREAATVERALEGGFDAVVHLAAITSVLESVKDPGAVFATNVLATELLLEACRERGIGRFVFASTNAVVGDVGTAVIDESIPLRPLTPYGATKAAGEMLLSAYAASYQMTTVALRFTNVYGAGMQTKDSVIARLMRAAITGGGIEIYGNGTQKRDYLYVTDAVAAILYGLSVERSDVLTIGSEESVSMNDLYRLTCEATGREIKAINVEAKPGEMPAVIVNAAKARRAGFTPAYDLPAGLAATWESYLASDSVAPKH